MSRTIVCTCGASAVSQDGKNMGKIANETGFCAIWDVSYGLNAIWLCPVCTAKVREAWLVIVGVAKTDTVHLGGFLKWSGGDERQIKEGGAV